MPDDTRTAENAGVILASDSLVAAWTDEERERRSRFSERIYAFAAHLPAGETLTVRLETRDKPGSLRACMVLRTENGDPSGHFDGLVGLLGEPDSPIVGTVESEVARPTPSLPHRYSIRRSMFRADTPSRRRPLQPTYEPLTSLRGLCAAMLDQPFVRLEVVVKPIDPNGRSLEDLARDANGPEGMTPELLTSTLRSGGPFVRATVTLACSDEPSPRLLSAIRAIGAPLEIQRLDDSRPTPETLGVRTLAALMRIPVAHEASFPGFPVVPAHFVRAPEQVVSAAAGEGIRLGLARDAKGETLDVLLPVADFSRHVYIPGQTGSGKSTLLRAMACEVAAAGHGILFIDPHGDAAVRLLGDLPASRTRDVHFIDASDLDAPAPINPFAVSDLLQRDTALANVTAMFEDLFDPTQQGIVGPRWESWFRMGMLTLIAAKGRRASLLDVPRLFLDKKYRTAQRASVKEQFLMDFWDQEMAQTNANTLSEVLGWFTSKFTAFRTNAVLRAVLGSGHDMLDPTEVMDSGKIIVVSLQKGEIGAPIAQLLGYLYLTRYWTAALRRSTGKPFALFVDEAQSFSKGALPDILAEGRKFGLYAVIANQYLEQLSEPIQHALLGNVGTVLGFRMGDRDAEQFAGRFGPEFATEALRRLPNHYAACSLLLNGMVQPAFSLEGDHISRLRGRSAKSMERQVASIKRSSQSFFKSSLRTAIKSPKPEVDANPAPAAESITESEPAVAAEAIGTTWTHPAAGSFIDALRAKLNRAHSESGTGDDRAE
jgi:hypothetical protein